MGRQRSCHRWELPGGDLQQLSRLHLLHQLQPTGDIQGRKAGRIIEIEQSQRRLVCLGNAQQVIQPLPAAGGTGVGAIPAAQRLGGGVGGEAVPECQRHAQRLRRRVAGLEGCHLVGDGLLTCGGRARC